ncbi:V-type ATP synthase subunit D [Lagierella sp.]|uniref:V-type ATP synthase subunit D n=1 Tax=Lagierella sp. TaxID=2849657 RepID=UPI0026054F1B|nr:V-type ATP synthase subunit D [Lagierella sp.]
MAKKNMAYTKGNLIKLKKSLNFAKKGFNLLDRKRVVLIREMMSLVDKAKELEGRIGQEFSKAYALLNQMNLILGKENLDNITDAIPKEKSYEILYRSVMGATVPNIIVQKDDSTPLTFGIHDTNAGFDNLLLEFKKIRNLIYELTEIENAVFNLASEINKTQKRANALEKIQIPKLEKDIKKIEEILEGKEIEEFFRLKKVKSKK